MGTFKDLNVETLKNTIKLLKIENAKLTNIACLFDSRIDKLSKENKELKKINDLYANSLYNNELMKLKSELNLYKDNNKFLNVKIENAVNFIKLNCIDDEFYINLTDKEKYIFDLLKILEDEEND